MTAAVTTPHTSPHHPVALTRKPAEGQVHRPRRGRPPRGRMHATANAEAETACGGGQAGQGSLPLLEGEGAVLDAAAAALLREGESSPACHV